MSGRTSAAPTTTDRLATHALGTKLAAMVAGRLVADIAAAGWPEGQVVGSEAELLVRYGVSRAVLREAVRLLEHQHVATMRRGPGGGLVVTAPTIESAMDAIMVYLLRFETTLDDVFQVRATLEASATELAADRLSELGLLRLRELGRREARGEVRDHGALHALLAAGAQNPALELFIDLLGRVTHLSASGSSGFEPAAVLRRALRDHRQINELVVAGQGNLAAQHLRRHLDNEARAIGHGVLVGARYDVGFIAPAGAPKLAERIARTLFAEVRASGGAVGQGLGSEPALMERFQISRAVLREAVRVLEYHEIARMRRGPGGGLFITEPGVAAAAQAVALHLDRRNVRPVHIFELRSIIEEAVVEQVVEHLDDLAIRELEGTLEAERLASREQFTLIGHDFHAVLATLTGNRVLELLTEVLVHLSRSHSAAPEGSTGPVPVEAAIEVHQRIFEAIAARDGALAHHRMRRHLEALVRWVR